MKTTGTDDARIGSTGADERIFGLIAIAVGRCAGRRDCSAQLFSG